MAENNSTCRASWGTHKNGRISDMRRMWRAQMAGEDSALYRRVSGEVGTIDAYGLSFEFIIPDDGPAYWRWVLGAGGPGDEFRFYANGPARRPYRISYVFIDWYDMYSCDLVGRDLELMREIWDCEFSETGAADSAQADARG